MNSWRIRGLLICSLLVGCQASPTDGTKGKLEVGISESDEYNVVFWAYVEPTDTIWFEMRWSWGIIEGADSTGAVALKPPMLLEDIWWKAWARGHAPDSIMWEEGNDSDTRD